MRFGHQTYSPHHQGYKSSTNTKGQNLSVKGHEYKKYIQVKNNEYKSQRVHTHLHIISDSSK